MLAFLVLRTRCGRTFPKSCSKIVAPFGVCARRRMRVGRTLFRSIKKSRRPAPKWKGARPAAICVCICVCISVKKRQKGSLCSIFRGKTAYAR
jgi:hypothetical protein